MGWNEWLDLIAKGAGTYFGYKDAKNKEEWQLDPKDLYAMQNPSSNTPFMSIQSDWNRGDPIINQTMSPQLQQAFDEHIWKAMAQPPSNYGYNENMDKLQNRAENYQLSRYGQTGTPYVKKTEPTSDLRYEPVGSDSFSGGTGQYGQGDGDMVRGDTREGSFAEPSRNTDYMDEIQRAALSQRSPREATEGVYDNPYSGGYMGYKDNWNANDITALFENQHGDQMYKDVLEFGKDGDFLSSLANNAPELGQMFSIATGLPFGGVAGQKFQDWLYNNYALFNPVDSTDPYGLANSQDPDRIPINDALNNQGLPRSNMNDGDTNYTPEFGQGRGANFGRGDIFGQGNGNRNGGIIGGSWGTGGSYGGGSNANRNTGSLPPSFYSLPN